jgi:hypothetical protein
MTEARALTTFHEHEQAEHTAPIVCSGAAESATSAVTKRQTMGNSQGRAPQPASRPPLLRNVPLCEQLGAFSRPANLVAPISSVSLRDQPAKAKPVKAKIAKKQHPKMKCPGCKHSVRVDEMARHRTKCLTRMRLGETRRPFPRRIFREVRPARPNVTAPPSAQKQPEPNLSRMPVDRFAFELLPAGTWDMKYVVNYYHQAATNPGPTLVGKEIQWERLRDLQLLEPARCSVGREGWHGYVIFEFSWTPKVVLECPIEGNAIYVLSGDWRKMVGHSKRYLRTQYAGYCSKVVHKGNWIRRLKDALRN